MSEPKICRKCTHHKEEANGLKRLDVCVAPKVIHKDAYSDAHIQFLVTGKGLFMTCDEARRSICGLDGKYFEEKES